MDGYRRAAQPGKVHCLKCGRRFNSPDRARIRRCPSCKKMDGKYGRFAEDAHIDKAAKAKPKS